MKTLKEILEWTKLNLDIPEEMKQIQLKGEIKPEKFNYTNGPIIDTYHIMGTVSDNTPELITHITLKKSRDTWSIIQTIDNGSTLEDNPRGIRPVYEWNEKGEPVEIIF